MNLTDLIEVDLSDNNLTKIPKDLSKLQKLKSLDLSNNPLKNVNTL
jgi:Leucine-rich repeat (LRR) protein